MPDIPERPHKSGMMWLDMIVGVSAILISCISLALAIRTDHTQERLLAASVWPFVQYSMSNAGGSEVLQIENVGVGPARVRWLTLAYHDRSMHGAGELLRACCAATKQSSARAFFYSTVSHTVLVPHRLVSFLVLRPTARDAAVLKRFDTERSDFRVRVCYCSVLDDCWIFDNATLEDPKPVPSCDPSPAITYDA